MSACAHLGLWRNPAAQELVSEAPHNTGPLSNSRKRRWHNSGRLGPVDAGWWCERAALHQAATAARKQATTTSSRANSASVVTLLDHSNTILVARGHHDCEIDRHLAYTRLTLPHYTVRQHATA